VVFFRVFLNYKSQSLSIFYYFSVGLSFLEKSLDIRNRTKYPFLVWFDSEPITHTVNLVVSPLSFIIGFIAYFRIIQAHKNSICGH